jgi:hypothetical protein
MWPGMAWTIGVSVKPGAMTFTLIRRGASSRVSAQMQLVAGAQAPDLVVPDWDLRWSNIGQTQIGGLTLARPSVGRG